VAPETAGDPLRKQKWVRRSLRTLSARLRKAGPKASPPTVGRLLTTRDEALHVNAKKREARSDHPDRATPCGHMADQQQACADAGLPLVSVDTKKKEVSGACKKAGRAWGKKAEAVNVPDYPRDAQGRAVPYGVYDVTPHRPTAAPSTAAPRALRRRAPWTPSRGGGTPRDA